MSDELDTVTLRLPVHALTIEDDEVACFTMSVADWKEWLPGFVSALENHPPVELEVRGAG